MIMWRHLRLFIVAGAYSHTTGSRTITEFKQRGAWSVTSLVTGWEYKVLEACM